MDATVMAVDLAKTVFEVAFANPQGRIVGRHRFNRRQLAQCLAATPAIHVVMEACGTAHYWGRVAQQHGHTVSLLPALYVRPYVRRNKTDRTDAEAILEAARSGQLPTVAVKRIEQQALVALHRIREQWMTTRTARINALRGLLREHGLMLPVGARAALRAVPTILEGAETPLPLHLRQALRLLHEESADSTPRLPPSRINCPPWPRPIPWLSAFERFPALVSSPRPRWWARSGTFTRFGARVNLRVGWALRHGSPRAAPVDGSAALASGAIGTCAVY